MTMASPPETPLLNGNSIEIHVYSIGALSGGAAGAVATVIAPGMVTIPGTLLSATFGDRSITISEAVPASCFSFLASDLSAGEGLLFNGLRFTTAATTPAIGEVAVNVNATTIGGFEVWFGPHDVFVDLRGLTLACGDDISLDLCCLSADSPEVALLPERSVGTRSVTNSPIRQSRFGVTRREF